MCINVKKLKIIKKLCSDLSQYLTNLMHKILFYNKFYFMPLHVSSTCATSSGGQNLHHTYRWQSRAQVERGMVHETATYRCDDTRGCVMQF